MSYKECYVAFLDIVAFSTYVRQNDFDTVKNAFAPIGLEQNCANPMLKSKYGIPYDSVDILIVSDSIIISVEKSIGKSLEAIIWMCSIFQTVLLTEANLLMRGGISCGDFHIKDTVLFGTAYLDAVEIEKNYNQPRIVIDKKIDTSTLFDRQYISYDPTDDTIFVDYMQIATQMSNAGIKLRKVSQYLKQNLTKFNNADDEKTKKIYEKYEWTKKYFNESLNDKNHYSDLIINEPKENNNGQT